MPALTITQAREVADKVEATTYREDTETKVHAAQNHLRRAWADIDAAELHYTDSRAEAIYLPVRAIFDQADAAHRATGVVAYAIQVIGTSAPYESCEGETYATETLEAARLDVLHFARAIKNPHPVLRPEHLDLIATARQIAADAAEGLRKR
ncbi:hypothetical protein [Oerskovia enterophila]|uniref:hypothetical protein n=1 Tax=Oerskovia enterophila TaxID=43678 RepID=UPI003390B12D